MGSHVLDALLASGYSVRALVREESLPMSTRENCTLVTGDLRRAGELVRALDGCRYLVHVGAVYSFSSRRKREIQDTNVQGCAGVLEAARIAGVERAVVTSSSATVGPSRDGRPATEEDWAVDSNSTYHQSKLKQERIALAARIPTVVILPTMPVGPGDWKPTPTGKMVIDFLRGRMFAALGGGINLVAVEDVARAHVLALRRGRPRERYLVGGENMRLSRLWALLAEISDRKAPSRDLPYHVALALGYLDEVRCRMLGRAGRTVEPVVPLEGVRMAPHHMYVSSDKAGRELDYVPDPAPAGLERAVRWYHDHGYVA